MIFYVLILSGMTCPFALKPVGSLSPAEQCYIARGDILNKETSFQPFPGKAAIGNRGNFENL